MEKITIKTTMFHKIFHALSIILLVCLFAFLIISWNDIPDKIPGHYNAAGEIDRWGSKGELISCPVIAAVLFGGLLLLEKYPEIWNTGIKITEKNSEFVYTQLRNMIVILEFLVVLIFSAISVCQILSVSLPSWFLLAELIMVFGTLAFFIIRILAKKKNNFTTYFFVFW